MPASVLESHKDITQSQRTGSIIEDMLRRELGANITFESVEMRARRGDQGHPNYYITVRNKNVAEEYFLHFRATPKEVQVECSALERARCLGVPVPSLVLTRADCANPFGAPFLIRQYVRGATLAEEPATLEGNFEKLMTSLTALHQSTDLVARAPSQTQVDSHRFRFEDYSGKLAPELRSQVRDIVDYTVDYYRSHADVILCAHACLVHRDLRLKRMIVSEEGPLYLTGWHNASDGDRAQDLAGLYWVGLQRPELPTERLRGQSGFYSYLKATMGSTRRARRAGI